MSRRSAIVLVIDHLQPVMLGPYGNTWVETPAWNALAAESFLFDQHYATTPELAEYYRELWSGREVGHAAQTSSGGWLERVTQQGVATQLLTDEPWVREQARFAEAQLLDLGEPVAAEEVEQTALAQFFAAAAAGVESLAEGSLLWLHCGSLGTVWDAPYSLRSQYADEEDPPSPSWAVPPQMILPDDVDPDEPLGIAQAYAGQISLLDWCLAGLHEVVRERARTEELAWFVCSPRGYPLGEHRRVGACDSALYGELMHAVAMIRLPSGGNGIGRSADLVTPADLGATIGDWLLDADSAARLENSLLPLLGTETSPIPRRSLLHMKGNAGERSVRTSNWFLRQTQQGGVPHEELFVKPDDRVEVNNVADRMPQIVQQLVSLLDQAEARPGVIEHQPLAPELCTDHD